MNLLDGDNFLQSIAHLVAQRVSFVAAIITAQAASVQSNARRVDVRKKK